jgi:hypothetical protein
LFVIQICYNIKILGLKQAKNSSVSYCLTLVAILIH